MIGQTLSHFRVTAKLGEGGMGEVYRAEDTKLGREVAIKVLPEAVAQDPERLARFEREAKVLASLNHPNIAAIYSIESAQIDVVGEPLAGSQEGASPSPTTVHFLVMELVEGEDLAERVSRGPVPADEVTPIALEVAMALEAAHDKGIIHRDLKPANIKVDADGQVKVLDFGLAKALDPETVTGNVGESLAGSRDGARPSPGALSMSPTLTAQMTGAGVILGTAAYMAPEQAKGKTVDRRADIWAYGVVLFEMLSGRRLFQAESVAETLGAIFQQEIDLDELPPQTPRNLRRLLERCLERDPKLRLRDIGEARIALSSPDIAEPESLTARSSEPPPRISWKWLPISVATLAAGLAVGMLGPWNDAPPAPATEVSRRNLILPMPGRTIDDSQAISPDGNWIAFTAEDSLWIRSLSDLEPREVAESTGAILPFWSPSSDAVAFASGDRIFKVALASDRPEELGRISGGDFTGGSWSATEGIVFSVSRANWDGDVLRIPEEGGLPEVFTQADPAKGERRLFNPHFLPDGHTLLFSAITFDANQGDIAVHRDGVRTHLGIGDGAVTPAWSPTGHLVFGRRIGSDIALWALPFSLETLEGTGEAVRIASSGLPASR